MERIYPRMAYNVRRAGMSPIVVPDESYDRALDDEWTDPYGVRSAPVVVEEPAITRKPGRPRKAER